MGVGSGGYVGGRDEGVRELVGALLRQADVVADLIVSVESALSETGLSWVSGSLLWQLVEADRASAPIVAEAWSSARSFRVAITAVGEDDRAVPGSAAIVSALLARTSATFLMGSDPEGLAGGGAAPIPLLHVPVDPRLQWAVLDSAIAAGLVPEWRAGEALLLGDLHTANYLRRAGRRDGFGRILGHLSESRAARMFERIDRSFIDSPMAAEMTMMQFGVIPDHETVRSTEMSTEQARLFWELADLALDVGGGSDFRGARQLALVRQLGYMVAGIDEARFRRSEAAWEQFGTALIAGRLVDVASASIRPGTAVGLAPRPTSRESGTSALEHATRRWPHSFRTSAQFTEFGRVLRRVLANAGLRSDPHLAGSAVSGQSYRLRLRFDAGRQSDFDVAIVDTDLYRRLAAAGHRLHGPNGPSPRTAPIKPYPPGSAPGSVKATGPDEVALRAIATEMSERTGRSVEFMVYRDIDGLLGRGQPTIRLPD